MTLSLRVIRSKPQMSHVPENYSKISLNYHCADLVTYNLFSQVFCLRIYVFLISKRFIYSVTKDSKPCALTQTHSSVNHYFSLRMLVDHLHMTFERVFSRYCFWSLEFVYLGLFHGMF